MTAAVGFSTVLAEQVRTKLAVLDLTAAGVLRRAVDPELVRAQLRSLIAAWRALLQAHHPGDGQSRCPRCRSWWGRRRAWPCGVWRSAHESLVVVGEAPRAAPDPEAAPAAVAWVRDTSPARPPGARVIPAPRPQPLVRPFRQPQHRPSELSSCQSPAGSSAPPRVPAGGTPGAAVPDPTPGSPAGVAAPGTSRGPRHARPEQPEPSRDVRGTAHVRVEKRES